VEYHNFNNSDGSLHFRHGEEPRNSNEKFSAARLRRYKRAALLSRTWEVGTMNILAIDDDALELGYVDLVLSNAGHIVRTAPSADAGLMLISEQDIDIVILDLYMPEKDGLEALMEIRRLAPRLPVIMMSAVDHTGSVAVLQAATLLGAFASLTKPVNDLELIAVVRNAANKCRSPQVAPESTSPPAVRA
jgi:DNA-binding response OmpR family regulator